MTKFTLPKKKVKIQLKLGCHNGGDGNNNNFFITAII